MSRLFYAYNLEQTKTSNHKNTLKNKDLRLYNLCFSLAIKLNKKQPIAFKFKRPYFHGIMN